MFLGKYNGKVLTIYISRDGVRVCEGENRNGNPDITKYFTVYGVSDYFTAPAVGSAPEIINMSGLVSAIVAGLKEHHTTSRRIMVCSDFFGIETTITTTTNVGGITQLLKGDVKSLKLAKPQAKMSYTADKIICRQVWGELTEDGKLVRYSSETVGDRYLLKSLVDEFYNYGYEVIFISGAQEVLLNFRETEPATFDSQGKIIFNYDEKCGVAVFHKDVLVHVDSMEMPDMDEIHMRLRTQLLNVANIAGRNPKIYLAGRVFSNLKLYNALIAALEAEDYIVYDLFNRPGSEPDFEEKLQSGEIMPPLSPDYSANIAMFMAPFEKNLISLTPPSDISDVFRRNSQAIATLVLCAAIGLAALSAVFAGERGWRMLQMKRDPSRVSYLQSQINMQMQRQQSLNATIKTLTEADTTILQLMDFIEKNKSPAVRVVTVDTSDMLPVSMSVDMSDVYIGADPSTETDVEERHGPRESIILRGYARTGNDAVDYYNKLFNFGLAQDPILNGVERYVLPGGEEVYVFEIEIGGVNG